MLTQIDDVLYVHFYVDGKEALYEGGTVIGALKDRFYGIRQCIWRNGLA